MVVGGLLASILSYFSVGTLTENRSNILHATKQRRFKQKPTNYSNGSKNKGSSSQNPVMKDNYVGKEKKFQKVNGPFATNTDSKTSLEVRTDSEENEIAMKKLNRSTSASSEGNLLNLIGFHGRSEVTSVEKLSRPASAFSALSTQTHPYSRSPIYASSHPNRVDTSPMPLPDQVENVQKFQTNLQKIQLKPNPNIPSTSQTPTSITVTSAETSSILENASVPLDKDRFCGPDISPMYERERAAPTPVSMRSPTPLWDNDGEKRVRFLESEVVETCSSRPSSGTSNYSNVIKNSTRFSFVPSEPDSIYGVIGHTPKICNCPCHFFPKYSQNVGVQVVEKERSAKRPLILRPYHPTHYRLFVLPSLRGMSNLSWSSKFTTFIVRALLSQIGLAVVVIVWWLIGALVFSTIEGPLQEGHVNRMRVIRDDLVIELATELRQVKPYDAIWKSKIEQYMLKLENAVLRAVKSGHTSSTITWTIADSFLYSISLTTLLGPGGLVIQSSLTRVFALVYAFVGIPIIFLLLFNIAQTVREGLTWAWFWRRKRRQVSDATAAIISNSLNNMDRGTLHSIEAGPSREISSAPQRERTPIVQAPRVSLLDNSPAMSRSGSAISHESFVMNSKSGETSPKTEASSNTSNDTPSSNASLAQQLSQQLPQPAHSQSFLVTSRNSFRQRLETEHFLRRKETIPWFLITPFPVLYLLLGTTLLAITQKWNVTSALFVIGSNLLLLDHGGTGNRNLFNSETMTFLYSALLIVGIVSMLIFTLGMWPKVTSSLSEAGRNLCVVKQIHLYR